MNKRIDLTQFEGLFEPNLLLHVFEEIKKVGFKDQTTVWAATMPPIYFGKQTVDAIEMLPELIAELKKCYEELDALRIGLNMAHKCLADHNFRQCHECGDHYHDDYGPLCGHTASE